MNTIRVFLHLISRYSFAVLTTSATTAVLILLRADLSTSTIALIFLLPVLINATYWALGPGLFSGLLAFLAFNYFFIQPYYTLKVNHTEDFTALVIFLVVALLTSQLVGRAKTNLAAAVARERETSQLYEMSVRLTGMNTQDLIAYTIVEETLKTFRADFVDIIVKTPWNESTILFRVPEDKPAPEMNSDLAAVLQTARGSLGELRVWRKNPVLGKSEARMLQTFAAHGAMALEQAALVETETRARVLEESDRMKTALLNSVSHELRTPLATIKASATSLLGKDVDWDTEARADLLTAIDEETDHLNHLVGNLLDMSRIEVGALQPDLQWNLLPEIVDSALGRVRRLTENHRLDVQVPDDLPLVPVDFLQIERVFVNLLSNSVKYAPRSSLICIRSEILDRSRLRIMLSNESPHVPEEDLGRIFDKFYRVTNANRVTGTGLGLSICKGIIDAHGGSIWAENLPGGFAFFIELPLTWDGRIPMPVDPEV